MLNCKQVTHLCSEELERDLSLGEQMGLGVHTLVCRGCKNYRKQMQFLRAAAKRYAGGEFPGAETKEKPSPKENV